MFIIAYDKTEPRKERLTAVGIYSTRNEWELSEHPYTPAENLYFESLFTLGNGYMAARGMIDEGVEGNSIPGFYVAGVFDHYGNGLYELVSLPNIFATRIIIDGTPLSMGNGEVASYSRTLDLKTGTLTRSFEWKSAGRRTLIEISRFISMGDRHLAAVKCKITPLDYTGRIEIVAELDKTVGNIDWGEKGTFELSGARHYHLDIEAAGFIKNSLLFMRVKTRATEIEVFQAAECSLRSDDGVQVKRGEINDEGRIGVSISFDARMGSEYVYERKISVFTSRDCGKDELKQKALDALASVAKCDFDDLHRRHSVAWQGKWNVSDITIGGNPEDQLAIRFNVFHMIQSNAENDPFVSIGGRLLGSEVFNGGVFWDTEIFATPFFIYTNPKAAKNLIRYRYNTMEKAKEKAKRHWLKGAMYPWTGVYDGREQCAFWEYANVEVHLTADIAYCLRHYAEASGDEDFLTGEGLEMLIETSRFWESRLFHDEKSDLYHLILVQGPDEYTGPVNNDAYTLTMAKLNLQTAIDTIKLCKGKYPDKLIALKAKCGFEDDEAKRWETIIARMYDDFRDEKQKIIISDETFLRRIPIDPATLKIPNKMLRFSMPSYDTLLRYQIVKQPSIILLMHLLPDSFTLEEKAANWNFYEPKTAHDSSLSYNTHSIMASTLGLKDKAYAYFKKTAFLDLDKSRDTDLGLHSACIGGTWQVVVNGFAGMKLQNGRLDFSPSLPDAWSGIKFKTHYKGKLISVEMERNSVRLESTEADCASEVSVSGKPVDLPRGEARTVKC